MKSLFFITQTLILGSLICNATAFAASSTPEVFTFKVEASLRKLTADPKHPGGVLAENANGSGSQTAQVILSKCDTYNGTQNCSGAWHKSLKIDDTEYFYFVNVYNTSKSDKHTAILFICLDAVTEPSECKRSITNQIDFLGKTAPRVSLYDSGHPGFDPGNPATYQPVLVIGEEVQ